MRRSSKNKYTRMYYAPIMAEYMTTRVVVCKITLRLAVINVLRMYVIYLTSVQKYKHSIFIYIKNLSKPTNRI